MLTHAWCGPETSLVRAALFSLFSAESRTTLLCRESSGAPTCPDGIEQVARVSNGCVLAGEFAFIRRDFLSASFDRRRAVLH